MSHLSRRDWILLALITALAFCLRLYRLDEIPPGLHHDEALNGLEAHELLTTGNRPIYIGSGFNGEPMLEYSMMVSESIFGMTPFAVRLPSALYGTLTIPIVFFLTLAIFADRTSAVDNRRSATRSALIAAFILATLYWHLNASRGGYKPVLLPLFGALAFWLLIKSFQPLAVCRAKAPLRCLPSAVACGIVLGLGFYTYPSIRFLYPVVALFIIFSMVRDRAHFRAYFLRALGMTLITLIVFAPLGIYYLQNPEAFFTRSNQVGVWVTHPNGVVGALGENTVKVAGMFFVQGDSNPRQNLPGRPVFDGILTVGFLVGLVSALRRWKQPTNFLLLLWLLAMLVPSIVTEAAPNFLRSLGASVPAVILVALGFDFLLDTLSAISFQRSANKLGLCPRRALCAPPLRLEPLGRVGQGHQPCSRQVRSAGSGMRVWDLGLVLLLLISATFSLNAYFNDLPHDPRAWFAFDVGLVKIGEIARAQPTEEPIYLTPFSSEQATIQFIMNEPRANFNWFDGRKCLLSPTANHSASMLVVSEDFRTLKRLQESWPQGQITQQVYDFAGKEYLNVFKIPPQTWTFMPSVAVQAVFSDQAMLLGYTFGNRIEAGQGIPMILFWRAQASAVPMQKAYTVFSHLLGPNNPRTHTPLWGQRDSQPCAGSYPTTRWSADEIIAEDFLIVVDKDTPAGQYQVEVGLYELANGARLKLPNGAERVLLGPVEIFRQ